MSKHPYKISDEFFSLSKRQIKDDIDDFFINYIKDIGGANYFNEEHCMRSKELYICGFLEYKDYNIDFNDN
ncbi:MAG: hypothetical protein ACOVK2_02425 [Candidatus Fonsibacter sp.]